MSSSLARTKTSSLPLSPTPASVIAIVVYTWLFKCFLPTSSQMMDFFLIPSSSPEENYRLWHRGLHLNGRLWLCGCKVPSLALPGGSSSSFMTKAWCTEVWKSCPSPLRAALHSPTSNRTRITRCVTETLSIGVIRNDCWPIAIKVTIPSCSQHGWWCQVPVPTECWWYSHSLHGGGARLQWGIFSLLGVSWNLFDGFFVLARPGACSHLSLT